LSVDVDFLTGVLLRRDHRQSVSHGIDIYETESVPPARHGENPRLGIDGVEFGLGYESQHVDTVRRRAGGGPGTEVGQAAPSPGERQSGGRDRGDYSGPTID
jgi:hypothetical protein